MLHISTTNNPEEIREYAEIAYKHNLRMETGAFNKWLTWTDCIAQISLAYWHEVPVGVAVRMNWVNSKSWDMYSSWNFGVFVLPEWRRMGVGKALAAPYKSENLRVCCWNGESTGFYKNMGFAA